ncbi:hypothetical protein [Chryseobacterium sp. Leaf180]|uniref:hypothetical protein n=1 Tax=Chryseobacterium sp. Leaf180 TaxID=1736289 RepID=UPI001EE75699|nr:hypothetical protein [Chryseobacterium sp. Leaf180]
MRELREKGELSPVNFGFKSWNQYNEGKYLMGSRKCTLLLGGEPNHGKSQVTNEMVMQMIEKHKFKVALFTTESGDVEKVFTQFCGLYQGKPYTKIKPDGSVNSFAMSDDEADEAEYFMRNHLFIFKQDRKDSKYQTLENIYQQLAKMEELMEIKFDSLVIDPIYDVDDFQPKADEVLRVLNRINLEAEENNRFDIIVNHVSETSKTVDQKTGKRRKLLALADEFYGGKNNNRKAMLQILVHRPEPNDGSDGNPVVMENQTNIHILKVKPEGIAKWGVYDIYYDWRSRRYYENYFEDGKDFFRFAECVKFYDRRPNSSDVDVKQIRVTPDQAFQTQLKIEQDDEDDFPF